MVKVYEYDDIVIAGIGMATSVGLTAKDTYYSVRAGVSRFRETNILDKNQEPVVMASIPSNCLISDPRIIRTDDPSIGRLLGLYHLACEDFANNISDSVLAEPYPLYIGIPERMLEENRIALLSHTSESVGIRNTSVRAFAEGRASSLIALHEATKDIKAGKIQAAYVAGCDSYVDLKILSDLDRASRLKSAANLNGFIPGEGSALLFVTTESMAKKLNCNSIVQLLGSNRGFEEGHIGSEKPYRGDGLSECVSGLFSQVGDTGKVDEVYSSMNGEEHWVKEWGVAYLRNKEKFKEGFAMNHPADCLGDIGSAAGVVLLSLLIYERIKFIYDGKIMIVSSSDQGALSSCIL